jgi:hypothetical protein
MKLNALTKVYAVLSHSLFYQMIKLDVLMVLLVPGPIGMPSKPSSTCMECCICPVFSSQGHL